MDGNVVGVALDAQAVVALAEHAGNAVESGYGGGLHLGGTALEKTNLAQTNDQAVGLADHGNFLALDFAGERGLEFGLKLGEIAVFFAGAGAERALGVIGDAAQAGGVLGIFYGLDLAEGHGLGHIDGDFRGGGLEDSHLLKSYLNGQGELSDFSFVDLRGGIEHDKEGKQEGDEVGVGNQPAIVIGVAGTTAAALHKLEPPALAPLALDPPALESAGVDSPGPAAGR